MAIDLFLLFILMLRENNQEFIKALSRDSDSSSSHCQLPKIMTPNARLTNDKLKVYKYKENDQFSWGNRSDEDQLSNTSKNKEQEDQGHKQQGSSPRIKYFKISQHLPKQRIYSSCGVDEQMNLLNGDKQTVKSEKSYNVEAANINQDFEHRPESDEDKEFQRFDFSMKIAKKLKNLETRIKSMTLKYENDLFTSKQEGSTTKEKLAIYEKYLEAHHPSVFSLIQTKIKEVEDNQNGFDLISDSSMSNPTTNKKSNNNYLTMPIYSQLQQVRLQAMKLCDQLKESEKTVNQLQNQVLGTKTSQKQKKERMMRKWSIPYLHNRQKKQSFQTTINSADFKEERKSRKSSNLTNQLKKYQYMNSQPIIKQFETGQVLQQNPSKIVSQKFIHIDNYKMDKTPCSKCNQLKTFIKKFNKKMKLIPQLSNQRPIETTKAK